MAGQGFTLADAIIRILADQSDLPGELNKAQQATEGWAGNLGGTVATLVGGATVAAATAAGAAVLGIGAAGFDMSNQIAEAVGLVKTQLNLTEEQAAAFGDTIAEVYGHNFGESIDDVARGLATAQQNLHELNRTGEDLGTVTEYAFALRDAFDLDLNESTRTANNLMAELGLTGEESFALITRGMQLGLNEGGDLLDTLNEYGADFADLGFTADEVLSLLNTGLENGVMNTDLIADAMREFKINLLDAGRLESIQGISPAMDEVIASFQAGEISGAEAFEAIQDALAAIEDPVAKQAAGVALFGSKWEDLGAAAILGLDQADVAIGDSGDAIESLNEQYDNLGSMWEGLKRRALVALKPLGDALLDVVNENMPTIEKGFDWFEKQLPKIIDVAVKAIGQISDWIADPVMPALEKFGQWWKEEMWPAIQPVVQQIMAQLIPGLKQLSDWVIQFYSNYFPLLADAAKWVAENFDIIGPILGVVLAAIIALTSPIGAIIVVLAALATAWANDWGGIQEKTAAFVEWFQTEVVPRVEEAIETIKDIVDALVEFFNEHILPRIENFFNIFKEIFEAFRDAFEGDWRGFGEHLRAAFDEAGELILGVMRSLGEIMLELLTNAVNGIISFVTETDWLGLGRNIIDGIASGIKEAIPNMIGAGEEGFNNLTEAWKGFWDIQSPSPVARDEFGRPIGEGTAIGIGEGLKDALENQSDISKAVNDAILERNKGILDLATAKQENLYELDQLRQEFENMDNLSRSERQAYLDEIGSMIGDLQSTDVVQQYQDSLRRDPFAILESLKGDLGFGGGGDVNINFAEPGPKDEADGEEQAQRILRALQVRGVTP